MPGGSERPGMPEGEVTGGQFPRPDGMFGRPQEGEIPEQWNTESERPEMPTGGERPEDMRGQSAGPGGENGFGNNRGEAGTDFLMNDKVNAFSGVYDYDE